MALDIKLYDSTTHVHVTFSGGNGATSERYPKNECKLTVLGDCYNITFKGTVTQLPYSAISLPTSTDINDLDSTLAGYFYT